MIDISSITDPKLRRALSAALKIADRAIEVREHAEGHYSWSYAAPKQSKFVDLVADYERAKADL